MPSFRTTFYKKVSSKDDISLDEGYPEKETQNSNWPRSSTLILSITTLIFGLYSLYLSLLVGNDCSIQGFKEGFSTEWSMTRRMYQDQMLIDRYRTSERDNSDTKSNIYKCITIQRNVQGILSRIRPYPTSICWRAEPRD